MKKQIIKISSVLFATVVMILPLSCNDSPENKIEGDPELYVAPAVWNITFAADGESAKTDDGLKLKPVFIVETNQKDWVVESNRDWLHVAKSGKNFTMSADANTANNAPEDAEVTVTAGKATPVIIGVTQLAAEPFLNVTPLGTITFSANGKTARLNNENFTPEFIVNTNIDGWKAESSDKTWLTVNKGSDNTFSLTAVPNPNRYSLNAKITVTAENTATVVFNVEQELNPETPSKYTDIVNPYAEVNFSATLSLRAALHNHTTASDGSSSPNDLIAAYVQRKYDIVAITDHDYDYVNKTDYGPLAMGSTSYMTVGDKKTLVIQGVEISDFANEYAKNNDHFNNFFVGDEALTLERQKGMKTDMGVQIESTDGIMVLNHPWRTEWTDPVEFFTGFFSTFPPDRLIGIEIGTKKGRETGSGSVHTLYDWEIWDACLTALAPARNIYGIATDDTHIQPGITAMGFFGLRWTEILVPENTVTENSISNVKEAMRNGKMFFVHNTSGLNSVEIYDRVFPSVNNIIVNKDDMAITVEAANYSKIEWISCGKTVQTDETTLLLDKYKPEKYVRFVLTGANGKLFSQPFLFIEKF